MTDTGPILKPDGRQSETALAIQRGLSRLLRDHDHAMLTEFTLVTGRRADVIALGADGMIWIIEIKSSPEDFYADNKWHEYREFCDRFSFAIPQTMDAGIIPIEAGLIIADQWGPKSCGPLRSILCTPRAAKRSPTVLPAAPPKDGRRFGNSSFVL